MQLLREPTMITAKRQIWSTYSKDELPPPMVLLCCCCCHCIEECIYIKRQFKLISNLFVAVDDAVRVRVKVGVAVSVSVTACATESIHI